MDIPIPRSAITGLILAGGRGSRMGGADKGLQEYRGTTLSQWALARLRPQVASVMINANRNLERYRAMGVAVFADALPDYPGPLAGMLAGLAHCATPYLVTVPCDTPNFPLDLVERLAQGLGESDADLATACTREDGELLPQPVFCLMKAGLRESLHAFIASGQRKTGLWARQQRHAEVVFANPAEFINVNTLPELEQLQRPSG
ncbi:MAG TPA: molybdenum cofactor guanylyltransferase MobA [Steroidobacteraceae bacterium]|nr:molybdenum cofactor guanylyltransferase MobA [Steroidobacteraceae bacterium]